MVRPRFRNKKRELPVQQLPLVSHTEEILHSDSLGGNALIPAPATVDTHHVSGLGRLKKGVEGELLFFEPAVIVLVAAAFADHLGTLLSSRPA